MATRDVNPIIHLVRTTMLRDRATMTDRELLESFVRHSDDAAFATLVHRHSPMVWGVCRRLLHRHHDAEDAFQATFLVLVRKATTIRDPEKIANWIYGVAHQTAIRARKDAARQAMRERQVSEMPEPTTSEPGPWNDLSPLLDQELSRLPAKYRLTLICCDLMGQTRKEASRQLGCPEGTVAGRLARARELLAKRLARNGHVVSGGAVAMALAPNSVSAGVPPSVVSATVSAAKLMMAGEATGGIVSLRVATLTERVLNAMWLSKIPMKAMFVFLVALLGTGLVLSYAGEPTTQKNQSDPPAQAKPNAGADAVPAAEIVSALRANEALFDEKFSEKELTVTGHVLRIRRIGDQYQLDLALGEPPVMAWFSLEQRKVLAGLIQGNQVTVRGVVKLGQYDPFGDKRKIYITDAKVVKDGEK